MVARDSATAGHLRGLGLTPIPAGQALAAMKTALLQGRGSIGIIDANWDKWMGCFPNTPWNRLGNLREESTDNALTRLKAELSPLSAEAKRKHVHGKVAEEVASVLHLNSDRLDTGVALRDLGLDSIMAVELQQALEVAIGIPVPTIELLGTSVTTVVQHTLDRLHGATGAVSIRSQSVRLLPSHGGDLATAFLARICVQPPYFALEDVTLDGELVEAFARPAAPSDCEDHVVNLLDAARHLAILGSCAASLRCPIPGKVYYPLVKMHVPESHGRRPSLAGGQGEPLARVKLRARCTEFDLRSSRATAETELLDLQGNSLVALVVVYHVIPQEQFAVLFRSRAEATYEQSGIDPYVSWRTLPKIEHKDGVASVNLGKVLPENCLGHFVGYPAFPVSVMGRDAIQLIAEGVAHEHRWHSARLSVMGGGVTTSSFVFAHESASLTARRVGDLKGRGHEMWECNVRSGLQVAARFEFECSVREAVTS